MLIAKLWRYIPLLRQPLHLTSLAKYWVGPFLVPLYIWIESCLKLESRQYGSSEKGSLWENQLFSLTLVLLIFQRSSCLRMLQPLRSSERGKMPWLCVMSSAPSPQPSSGNTKVVMSSWKKMVRPKIPGSCLFPWDTKSPRVSTSTSIWDIPTQTQILVSQNHMQFPGPEWMYVCSLYIQALDFPSKEKDKF